MNSIEHLFINLKFQNQDESFLNFYSALVKEIDELKENHQMQVQTIYLATDDFLLLANEALVAVLTLLQQFVSDTLVEYSFEIGYQTINQDQLSLLQQFKINRLVWRVRTFNNGLLVNLNPNFNSIEMFHLIKQSIKLGYNNFSIDLENNIQNQLMNDIISDLEIALQLKAPHISYQSHNDTHDYQSKKIISQFLADHNYHNYEFFSFAKQEVNYAKQTIAYLTLKNWYGLGPGAISLLNNVSITNSTTIPWSKEIAKISKKEYYQLLLSQNLMLSQGLNLEKYPLLKKQSIWLIIDNLIKNGDLELKNNCLRATNQSWVLLNQILVDIINNT